MKSRRFRIFCFRREMVGALEATVVSASRAIKVYKEDARAGISSLEEVSAVKPSERKREELWLDDGGTRPSSFSGLVQVVLPDFTDETLSMSSIAIKLSDSNKQDNIGIYNELRKRLKNISHGGIWGINVKTNMEEYYKDIFVSESVSHRIKIRDLRLLPDGGGGFVRFECRRH